MEAKLQPMQPSCKDQEGDHLELVHPELLHQELHHPEPAGRGEAKGCLATNLLEDPRANRQGLHEHYPEAVATPAAGAG